MHLPSAPNPIHAKIAYLLDMAQCRLVHQVATVRRQGNCGTEKHRFETPGNNTAKNKRGKG